MAEPRQPYECLVCILKAFLADEPYTPVVETVEEHVNRCHLRDEWPINTTAHLSIWDEFESLKGRVIARVVRLMRSGEWPPSGRRNQH
jgi:hypothetical protein